ncbi:zf-HC2 domain-containing protein [Nonomuraea pusilla]|uniref:anti-sigma factor family protein n=1 Tax=Nonomuraea pusilla TaxID=46177 RepID=UPI003320AE00
MTWHMDDGLATRYADGDLDATLASSVEAHLLACGPCRELLAPRVPRARLDRVWEEIAEAVDSPVPGPFERALRLVGVREHTARLLGAASSLRLSWISAGALALLFAVLAAGETTRWGLVGFLALAPMLPVAGVGVAYGRGADPAYEIGLAAPYPAVKVMLMRAAAVLVTSALPALVIGLAVFGRSWAVAAWLLPALALTSLSLVLSRWFEPAHCAIAVSALWLACVAVTNLGEPNLAMFGAAGQLASLAVTVVSCALLAARGKQAS